MIDPSALCLFLVMRYEAGSAGHLPIPIREQAWASVAYTVINRAKHSHTEICTEATRPRQYAIPIRIDGKPYPHHYAEREMIDLANRILKGKVKDPTNRATHFCTVNHVCSWERPENFIVTIWRHDFYE